jgi:mannosylglucosylglycerate synthase
VADEVIRVDSCLLLTVKVSTMSYMPIQASFQPNVVPGVILDVHYKLFGTDGVSLQSQELTEELARRGWTVHLCASDVPHDHSGLQLAELSYQTPDVIELRRQIFQPTLEPSQPGASSLAESALLQQITARAVEIQRQMEMYVDMHGIRLIHIRNIMALPLNLPATLAFYQLATARPHLQFILHHHDLMWEGPNAKNFKTPYPRIAALIDRIICPQLPNATHVLINPLAAVMLKQQRGINGQVIPDGFNFERRVLPIDEAAFRANLELLVGDDRPITDHDLVVGMMTRVAINKAIELAIQFVAQLQQARAKLEATPKGVGSKRRRFTTDSRIILLLGQGEDLSESNEYFQRLLRYAEDAGVTVAYAGNMVVPDSTYPLGSDQYPFYSTYQAIDLVCYPTEHEGFGNQAIEAVWAKRLLALHEYPVFTAYIRDYLPKYISLGTNRDLHRSEQNDQFYQLDQRVIEAAVRETIALLRDPEREHVWTEENYRMMRTFCGIQQVTDLYVRLYTEIAS